MQVFTQGLVLPSGQQVPQQAASVQQEWSPGRTRTLACMAQLRFGREPARGDASPESRGPESASVGTRCCRLAPEHLSTVPRLSAEPSAPGSGSDTDLRIIRLNILFAKSLEGTWHRCRQW